jgi:hypothetical protein
MAIILRTVPAVIHLLIVIDPPPFIIPRLFQRTKEGGII